MKLLKKMKIGARVSFTTVLLTAIILVCTFAYLIFTQKDTLVQNAENLTTTLVHDNALRPSQY